MDSGRSRPSDAHPSPAPGPTPATPREETAAAPRAESSGAGKPAGSRTATPGLRHSDHRIGLHPILPSLPREEIRFTWRGEPLPAHRGETIAAALFANGIRIFGHHHRDGSPQGIFCANGQCAQCTVIADRLPVKACMIQVRDGMRVEPAEGLPVLPPVERVPSLGQIETLETECLILGGGPAGLAAAIELGKAGVRVLLVDDKHRLGGKLVLQTHKFFGSIEDCYAGTRGIDIATLLEEQVRPFDTVTCWVNSTALAVFSDATVGILRDGREYLLVRPQTMLVATGAREKSLTFRGNTLPGVYGAGAFQTLVNRDLVRPAEKLFIVGGGNVGLIAGYHALQAGIAVVGLVEALPECGGYKVHKDKLARFGVPIHTSHTILSANGCDGVESVTIARIDESWQPIPGSERSYPCDTILVAVGLEPVSEFYHKAVQFGLQAFAAGDADEIAEASAAIFSGKIKGLEIAAALGRDVPEIPAEWTETEAVLKSRPGRVVEEEIPLHENGVWPIFHCHQEIPCNPCISVCPEQAIEIGDDIRGIPHFIGERLGKKCTGCCQCVTICPGLAVTVIDYRRDPEMPVVNIAHEFCKDQIAKGDEATVLDTEGQPLGRVKVIGIASGKKLHRALLVRVRAPKEIAERIAGIQIQSKATSEPMEQYVQRLTDDTIVCRCERVTAGEVRELIRSGVRDINEIKTITRAGMGACGAKTCGNLIRYLYRQEGIELAEVMPAVLRPLFVEVPLGAFCRAGADRPAASAPPHAEEDRGGH